MRRTLPGIVLATLAFGPSGAAPLIAGGLHVADVPHDCRGMPCERAGRDPFTQPPCSVPTVACAASALVDLPYALGAFDADQTKTAVLGPSLRSQRTPSVRTPPPRS